MASNATVDLVVDASGTLPELERQLTQIIQRAEDTAPAVELRAEVDVSGSLADATSAIRQINQSLENAGSPIELDVQLDEDSIERANRLRDSLGNVGERARTVSTSFAGLASSIGGMGAAVGGAVPALAGLVGTVQQLGPAAAVAVSGMVAMRIAAGTLKLAMLGVGEAIGAAFDPDADPEELAKAMERLAPNAREFVTELTSMREELVGVQQNVQNRVFEGFAGALRSLSSSILPDVATTLDNVAGSLNQMALGAAAGASQLDSSGALGQALSGSETALRNLEGVPQDIVVALGTLAAAGGPALDRLTKSIAGVADSLSGRLARSFEAGTLTETVNRAADAVARLGGVAKNIFTGIGNVIGTADEAGGGFLNALESITQAFADVTATKGFQDAIRALSETMATVVSTVLPLLSQALQALGPVFTVLGPPIQELVRVLGDALSTVLEALGPVLVSVASALGGLAVAVAPFIELAGNLIAAILPALTPLFTALGDILRVIAPVVGELARILGAVLVPVFNLVSTVLAAVIPPFVQLYSQIFPPLQQILSQLRVPLEELAVAFNDVFKELGPLIAEVLTIATTFVSDLIPAVTPVIRVFVDLVSIALRGLTSFIQTVLVPALRAMNALFRGDTTEAMQGFRRISEDVSQKVVSAILNMRNRVVEYLQSIVTRAGSAINSWAVDMQNRVRSLVTNVVNTVRGLPGDIASAVSSIGSRMFAAGVDAGQGFLNGLRSMVGQITAEALRIANSVVNTIASALQIRSPSRVTFKQGEDTGKGFVKGIEATVKLVAPAVKTITDELIRQIDKSAVQYVTATRDLTKFITRDPRMTGPLDDPTVAFTQTPTISGVNEFFSRENALRITEGHQAPVVNVYLGNELVNQYVNDSLRTLVSQQNRTIAQGVRI